MEHQMTYPYGELPLRLRRTAVSRNRAAPRKCVVWDLSELTTSSRSLAGLFSQQRFNLNKKSNSPPISSDHGRLGRVVHTFSNISKGGRAVMPADYDSTARALALPVSPPRSPTQQYRPPVPWSRRSLSASRPAAAGTRQQGLGGFRDRTINGAERIWRQLLKTTEKMTPLQQALTFVLGIVAIVLAILFLVFSEKIFAVMEPVAEKWKNLSGGWLILWAMTFVTAFPPVIGYSTCLTLAGFVYGFPAG